MINLTELLLKSAPTRNRLAFGINSNVVVKSCSNEVKRDKDNVIIERNAFIVLAKIDPETLEILAESEMSYFNLTHAGMAYDNFFHQLNQLPYITAAFLPQKKHIERFEHMLNKFKFKHLELNNKLIATADIAKEKWKKTSVSTDASTAEIAAMTGMLKELTDMCFSVLNMFSGVKRTGKAVGILADVMLVCTKKSSFLNFPKTAEGFIAPTGKKLLTLSNRDKKYYEDHKAKKAGGDEDTKEAFSGAIDEGGAIELDL